MTTAQLQRRPDPAAAIGRFSRDALLRSDAQPHAVHHQPPQTVALSGIPAAPTDLHTDPRVVRVVQQILSPWA